MPIYIGLLFRFARTDTRFASGLVSAALILLFVGYGSWVLSGFRSTGVNATVLRKRGEKATRDNTQAYHTEVKEKIGATLTTLTALGSISFAMVLFALPIMLDFMGGGSRITDAFAKVTLYFMFFIMIATCIMFLIEIESYDTARDPVWNLEEIEKIRWFTITMYNLTLCSLVYTVLLAALVVNELIAILGGLIFAVAVGWFDSRIP